MCIPFCWQNGIVTVRRTTRTATVPKSNFGDTTVTNSRAGHMLSNYDDDILVSW